MQKYFHGVVIFKEFRFVKGKMYLITHKRFSGMQITSFSQRSLAGVSCIVHFLRILGMLPTQETITFSSERRLSEKENAWS